MDPPILTVSNQVMLHATPARLLQLIPSIAPRMEFTPTTLGGLSGEQAARFGRLRHEFRFTVQDRGRTDVQLTTSWIPTDDLSPTDAATVRPIMEHASARLLSAVRAANTKRLMAAAIEREGGVSVRAHADVCGSYALPLTDVYGLLDRRLRGEWDSAAGCFVADAVDGTTSIVRRIWLRTAADGGTEFSTHVVRTQVFPKSMADAGQRKMSADLSSSLLKLHHELAPETLAAQATGSCPLRLPEAPTAAAPEPQQTAPVVRPVAHRLRRSGSGAARSSRPADWLGL